MPRSAALFMLALGAAFAVVGVVVVRPTVPSGWTSTEGVVVGHEEREGSEGDTLLAAIVEYVDVDGVARRVTSSLAASGPVVEAIGSRIPVAYDPARPDDVRIVGGALGFVWLFFAGGGLLFAGVGAAALRSARP